MSHHFDTPTAREDPRLNLCDFYLFAGSGDTTVMAMTVNPTATQQTPEPFRDEAVYAFRFDTDGDQHEDVSFKVRFTGPSYEVYRADHAPEGLAGDVIFADSGHQAPGVQAFAGVVDDPFAGDAPGLEAFKAAFAQGKYEPAAFARRADFFRDRTVATIVLEVPNHLISKTIRVNAWATVSLYGHAPEQQVARWGLPLFTHIFLGDSELREQYNRTGPADDISPFTASTVSTVRDYTRLAGTASDPEAYGRRVADLFASLTLPYELGSVASFDYTGFNGRSLADNVMDTMLSLLTNSPLGTGIAPDPARFTSTFPYLCPARPPKGSDHAVHPR